MQQKHHYAHHVLHWLLTDTRTTPLSCLPGPRIRSPDRFTSLYAMCFQRTIRKQHRALKFSKNN